MKHGLTIWQIKDGKRGHENQSAGLIQALAETKAVDSVELSVETSAASWIDALLGRFPPAARLPRPDLIVGAGSRTHSTILAAGRATGAPTVVLMAPPPLLARFFTWCAVPEHDGRSGPNIITTKGALNTIRPEGPHHADRGLILVGGPSAHHDWDEAALIAQIKTLLEADPAKQWTLTTSRRTPAESARAIAALADERLEFVPVEATGAGWVSVHLAEAGKVWVTEDSVSMVYEALSSGARTGILPVPRKSQSSRVIRGLDTLVREGRVTRFDSNEPELAQASAPVPLDEARRVAGIILRRFGELR